MNARPPAPRRARIPLRHGLCLALAAAGCGLSSQEGGGAADAIKKPELLCARAGAERVEASSFRGDGKNDIVKVFTRSSEPGAGGLVVLSCKELDLNGDGRKDMLVYFDSKGRRLREEFDHDFDGLADMKSYYEGGQLVRQELDINFDGKPDVVEYFEGGKRVRMEKLLALPPTVAAPAAGTASPAAPPSTDSSAPPASSTAPAGASSLANPPSLPSPPTFGGPAASPSPAGSPSSQAGSTGASAPAAEPQTGQ